MSEIDDQAGADQDNDQTVIVDPLDALMKSTPSGTDDFSDYESERAALLKAVPEDFNPQAEAVEEFDDQQEDEEHEPEEGEEEQEDPEPEDEEEEATARKGTFRTRLRRQDDIAIAELARALDIPLLEAAKKFEAARGEASDQTEQQEQVAPTRTYAQARAELAAKIDEQADAIDAVDFESQKRLFREIESLRDELPDLKDSEREATVTAKARESEIHESVYFANEDKAIAHYPGLKDPDSPISKALVKIYAQAVAMGDPQSVAPDRAWTMAVEAAQKTRTLMTQPKTATAQKTEAKRNVSPFQPAGGNARTTSADTASAATEIAGIDSLEAYEKAVGRR